MRSAYEDPIEQRGGGGGGPQFAFPAMTPVVKRLLIVNAALFVAAFLLWRFAPAQYAAFESVLALDPVTWRSWFPILPVWQLYSYGYLHSPGDPAHILFNLLAVYFFGTYLEAELGSRRFFVHYSAAIALGGLLQLALSLATGLNVPTIGASGGCLFTIVAMATLFPRMRVIFILFPITLRTLALILVGLDVYRMLAGGGGTAWLVHLVGAAYGFAGVRTGWLRKDPVEVLEARRQQSRERVERDDERRLDALLDKIHREGMHALSKSEKAFLKRVSSRR